MYHINGTNPYRLFPHMMGGPFFTSVPSGRVGPTKDYGTNDVFVRALLDAESQDQTNVNRKMSPIQARTSLENVSTTYFVAGKDNRTFLFVFVIHSFFSHYF
jgi:hypothetical protein